jgi:hypothetical protein
MRNLPAMSEIPTFIPLFFPSSDIHVPTNAEPAFLESFCMAGAMAESSTPSPIQATITNRMTGRPSLGLLALFQ